MLWGVNTCFLISSSQVSSLLYQLEGLKCIYWKQRGASNLHHSAEKYRILSTHSRKDRADPKTMLSSRKKDKWKYIALTKRAAKGGGPLDTEKHIPPELFSTWTIANAVKCLYTGSILTLKWILGSIPIGNCKRKKITWGKKMSRMWTEAVLDFLNN